MFCSAFLYRALHCTLLLPFRPSSPRSLWPSLCVSRAFATLCTDSTPMVRRAAAENLEKMMELCSPKVVEDRLKVLFLRMMDDEQVSGWLCESKQYALTSILGQKNSTPKVNAHNAPSPTPARTLFACLALACCQPLQAASAVRK